MSALFKCFSRCAAFFADRRGNVAVIWALALVPLMAAIGGGLDLARALIVKAEMTSALDAAALAVGSSTNLTTSQMQTLAQQYFNANYTEDASYGTPAAVTINPGTQSIQIATSCDMPTSILKVIGLNTFSVTASSTVVWGQLKLWVSLVLDNTGSMTQTDSSGLSKMTALKDASHQLLTMLQGASSTPGDVRAAIIPFVKDVNAGTASVNATWIDWTEWNANNGSCSGGSGSTQSICTVAHCSKSQYTTQYDCRNHRGTWYNAGTWTPANHSYWNGCVTDRGYSSGPDTTYDYDVTNSSPVPGRVSSQFPAEQYSSCPQSVMGISYDWASLNNKIDAMQANGSTNQTIGLVWGWHALSNGDPLDPPGLPADTQRFIILLSDGLNTQDRWYGDGYNQSYQVDNRMALACSNAKADGIIIYAVFVDIGGTQGNSSVLQSCATDAAHYFDLTTSAQIVDAFKTIGQQITNLRVSQ